MSSAGTMTEHNMNGKKLKLVSSNATSRGSDRKQRRLAGAITVPEPDRPRLPVQGDTAKIFDLPAWRKCWGGMRAMAETTGVYIAGCTGTMALGGAIGMPTLKPGTTQDVDARMRKLNSERYGSVVDPRLLGRGRAGLVRLGGRQTQLPPDPPGVTRTGAAATTPR